MFAFFGLFEYFDQGCSYCFLFLRVDCEGNRPSFLGTVFADSYDFNGDLSRWDVANVIIMSESKSIRVVENDLTFRELMLLCHWKVPSGVWG
jgi:surface protein